MTRMLVVGFGSFGPAWMVWDWVSPRGIMAGFLCAVVAFACGWYVSRQFIRQHLDY